MLTSLMPERRSCLIVRSSRGRSPTGSIGLGTFSVSGSRRLPKPPAMMTADSAGGLSTAMSRRSRKSASIALAVEHGQMVDVVLDHEVESVLAWRWAAVAVIGLVMAMVSQGSSSGTSAEDRATQVAVGQEADEPPAVGAQRQGAGPGPVQLLDRVGDGRLRSR